MRHGFPRCLLLLLLPLLGVVPSAAEEADEPVLLLQSASGTHEVDDEGLLIIQDIEGTLSIRAATDSLLRFEGRSLNSQRELQEVALWRADKRTLLLGPGADVEDEGTLVDMIVPDSLDVEVVLNGGRLLVSAIGGDLLVDAEGANVQARGLKGGATFFLQGGVLRVDGVKGSLVFEGNDVDAEFQHLYADAELETTLGRTRFSGSDGELAIVASQTELEIEAVEGQVRVAGEGGNLRLVNCGGGGDVQLEESSLVLMQSKGDFVVRTDSAVEFYMHQGPLSIFSYGAPVRGTQVTGPLIVENNNSTIQLEQILGTTEIRGSDLELQIKDSKGPVTVHTVSSTISINGTKSPVVIENDYGDVRLAGTEASAKINSRGGDVHVSNHQGPLELRADGPEVRVEWNRFTKQDPVTVHNETGDIHLALPAAGRCRLQLKAAFGRIDSELAGLRIADDGHSAGGEYTGGRGKAPQVRKPLIKATSGGGNIYLTAAASKN